MNKGLFSALALAIAALDIVLHRWGKVSVTSATTFATPVGSFLAGVDSGRQPAVDPAAEALGGRDMDHREGRDCEEAHADEHADRADDLRVVIVRQADHPDQVERSTQEDPRPKRQDEGTGDETPVLQEVDVREELEGHRELDEPEHSLDGYHPVAGLPLELVGPGGEDGEEEEGRSEGACEGEHADGGVEPVALGGPLPAPRR